MFELSTDESDPALREAVRAFRRRKRLYDAGILALPIGIVVLLVAFMGTLLAGKFSVPTLPIALPSIYVGLFLVGSIGGATVGFQILSLGCPRCRWIIPLKYAASRQTGHRSSIGTLPADCPHCGLDLDPDRPRLPSARLRADRAAEIVAAGDPAIQGKVVGVLLVAIILVLGGGAVGAVDRVSAGWIAVGILPLLAVARNPGWRRFPRPLPPKT